jgi:(p)ppGpp synthase/HD superfamily hydrolase
MKYSPDNFESEFEDAIRILTNAMPPAEELEKPTLIHNLRVAIYLYTHGYSRQICLGGLLHDAIEDTKITLQEIEERFGKEVSTLVQANTKNNSLQGMEKYEELTKRCIEVGQAGAIIKAADILDNYIYYSKINELEGKNWMIKTGNMLLKEIPEIYTDPIFDELKQLLK